MTLDTVGREDILMSTGGKEECSYEDSRAIRPGKKDSSGFNVPFLTERCFQIVIRVHAELVVAKITQLIIFSRSHCWSMGESPKHGRTMTNGANHTQTEFNLHPADR